MSDPIPIAWFVGAYIDHKDKTEEFRQAGVWEILNPGNYERNLVLSMRPGERIAIKAAYTQKKNLPFDNRGNTVSVMAIKATGTILENPGDGCSLKVRWDAAQEPRPWYFFTARGTVWKVLAGDPHTEALLRFTFAGEPQDLPLFQEHPFWKERFGTRDQNVPAFAWTLFYQALADRLRENKSDRASLLTLIRNLSQETDYLSYLKDQTPEGQIKELPDIDPFTFMGMFNRSIKDENRRPIAARLSSALAIEAPLPQTFEGIPLLHSQSSMLFSFEKDRNPADFDTLWTVFEAALDLADDETDETRARFVAAYDAAIKVRQTSWNLTMGLFWIRPWSFVTLDHKTRRYLAEQLSISVDTSSEKRIASGKEYLALRDRLLSEFKNPYYSVHSFPSLSHKAWLYADGGDDSTYPEDSETAEPPPPMAAASTYTLEDLLAEGCFLQRERLQHILERLRTKRNLILQGPPGTGKTWLAKRLGYALIGAKNDRNIRALQFHPNLSYEDFIRGFRPSGNGTLSLTDGPFLQMVQEAKLRPEERFVLIIEEINRGNPAQIFGEMLTLMEIDKRTPEEALTLSYHTDPKERVYIPPNLYLVGTMNIADRSLALVDLALRRRFAFIDLEPVLGEPWRRYLKEKFNWPDEVLRKIEGRVMELNQRIAADPNLGPAFRIGHSYVTPSKLTQVPNPWAWFQDVVATEIGPLLDEYWFEDSAQAQAARQTLLQD